VLQAATALSTAAEACIDMLGDWQCAPEGTQAWADGGRLRMRLSSTAASRPLDMGARWGTGSTTA
jgi:hypothetical protein